MAIHERRNQPAVDEPWQRDVLGPDAEDDGLAGGVWGADAAEAVVNKAFEVAKSAVEAYFNAPNTLPRIAFPLLAGSCLIFFSSSPIMK